MKRLITIFLSAVLLSLGSHAIAQQGKSDLQAKFERLRVLADTGVYICSMKGRTALIKASIGQPWEYGEIATCIDDRKRNLRADFAEVRDALEAKQRVQDALKDWFAAWLTLMDSLQPLPGEGERRYNARVSDLERPVKQMIERISLDL